MNCTPTPAMLRQWRSLRPLAGRTGRTRSFATVLAAMLFMLLSLPAWSQVLTIGSGTSVSGTTDNGNPIYRSSAASSFGWSRSVQLYTAADLAALPNASQIDSIAFDRTNAFTMAAGRTAILNITLKNSSATTLVTGSSWNTMTSGGTLVYSNAAVGAAAIPAAAGYTKFRVNQLTPFIYSGGAIEVYLEWSPNGASASLTTGSFLWRYAAVAPIQAMGTSNTGVIDPATFTAWSTLARRYNVRFMYSAAAACGATPVPGNTLASATTVCPESSVNLSLQNSTGGSGVSYAWEVSTTGAAGTYSPVAGTSAAITVNPAVQSWYRCNVTCAGNGTGTSNPVQIDMDPSFTNPQAFASVSITNGCWQASGSALAYNALSAFGIGTGSARWNFFNVSSGQHTLTSPYFTALPTGYQIKFDVAGAFYDAFSVDTVKLEEFNGTSWVLIQTMTDNVGDALNTQGTLQTGAAPNSAQWATRTFALSAGSTRVRFRGISAFGNNVFIDNISVEAAPVCLTPADLVGLATSLSTATISWTDNGAMDYNLEIRSSGAAGSGPAGLVASPTGLSGSPYFATGLPADQNLQVYVQGNCDVNGLSPWSNAAFFRTGYCLAQGLSVPIDERITNFSVSNLNNTSSGTTGYEDFTGGTAIDMATGVNYPFTVTSSPLYNGDEVLIWIDLNNDLDFDDVGELRYTSIALPASGSLSIPGGTPAGNYRMRVRLNWTGSNITVPCDDSDYGEVEDYTVTVCGAPLATATLSNDDCANNSFDAVVNFTSLGSGGPGSGTITYSVSGGTPVTLSDPLPSSLAAAGMVATTDDYVSISVGNGTLCSLDLGRVYSNCADTLVCGIVTPDTYCYQNNDTRTFHYVAEVGQTVSINFIQGSLDLGDAVNFFSAPDNLSGALGGGNFSGDLSTADFTTTGRDLFFQIISTNGSNSCYDGGQSIPWQWEVQCTPDCTPPQGFVEYVTPISCTPPGFYLNVTVASGGAASPGGMDPLSTVDIVWSGGASGSLDGVAEDVNNPYTIGPFPLGSSINVVLRHVNALCNLNLGNFTQASTCPPANDECVNAQALTVSGIDGCPAGGVSGTTAFGTNSTGGSVPSPTCNSGAGTIQDVWYSFNTANNQSPIAFNITSGTISNYSVELYAAGVTPDPACLGGSIGCLSGSPAAITFTNAPANTLYYLRIFTNSGTGTPGTFSICIAGSPCPAPTAVSVSSISSGGAVVAWTGAVGNYVVEYGPSATFTTPGTGATAGTGGTVVTATASPVALSGLDPSTNYVVFVRRDCGSPDGFSFNSAATLFVTSSPPVTTTQGTCALGLAIPDNGCGSGSSLSAQFPISTVGTLGGSLVLESVDLIITHTFRSDLEVSLISPNGTTRSLILGEGGSNADFGDNTNCPTAVFKLRDGAAALSTLPFSDATVGTYAPEQTLSGFSGPSNGNWQVLICDGAGIDVGNLEYVKLNFANCVGPTYTTTVVPACGTNRYSVSVSVTNLGSASSYVIHNSLNGSVVNVPATGTYSVGPFASGSTVNLTLTHNVNTACNASTSGITFTCPPANNGCANAIAITCNSVTSGSTVGGDNIGNPGTCLTDLSTASGVWYTVQGWGGTMTASTCDAAGFDTKLGVFTGSCGSFTCVTGNDDGICTSNFLTSDLSWSSASGTTYYIYVTGFSTNQGAFVLTIGCGDVAPPPCSANGLSIEIEADANTFETSWDIIPQGLSTPVCSGSGPYISGSVIPEYCCLPNGCYRFRVSDSAGDGILNGGYNLRTMTTGNRIIDNTDNFTTGGESAISTTVAGGNFCLPIGTDKLIFSSCDKLNWTPNTYIVASANASVSAQWLTGASQADDGYEFWIFDPNGTYSYRKFRSHSVSDGFSPANATRACHMKINSWVNTIATPLIPFNKLLNVRVRGRVNGANFEFGPACRFKLVTDIPCPQVGLQDDPSNADFSCGVTRNFTPGGNTAANRIVARPPQFVPANVASGSVRYQFRFRLVSEGICIIRPAQTSPTLLLNWTPGTGNNRALECGKQYDVEVRVSKDSGVSWCVDAATVTCASPYVQWGPVCKLTITACPSGLALQNGTVGNPNVALYPNPNQGQQLFMNVTNVDVNVNTVSMDIYDMTGKRVSARTIAIQDGYLNTVIDLHGDLAGGLYMVNITAGDKTYTERLVIQP